MAKLAAAASSVILHANKRDAPVAAKPGDAAARYAPAKEPTMTMAKLTIPGHLFFKETRKKAGDFGFSA